MVQTIQNDTHFPAGNYLNQNINYNYYDRCFLHPCFNNSGFGGNKLSNFLNDENKNIQQKTKKKSGDQLCIALLNIRSIRNKLNELAIYIESLDSKPQIIIITESWLKNNETQFFNLDGYQSITNCRSTHRGGGIIIFIRDDIKFNVIKNEQFDKSHLIIISISTLNIKIAGFYRSPSTKSEQFLEILENILDNTDNLVCFGDSNIDLLKISDHNVQNYLHVIEKNGYNILNSTDSKYYTYREEKNGKEHISILDHIFSDKIRIDDDFNLETNDVCFSDHRLLLFKCNLLVDKQIISKQKTIVDFDKISTELDSVDCTTYDFNDFMNIFTKSVKTNTKTKLIRNVHDNKKIWLDSDLKLELKKRKELFKFKKNNPENSIYKKEFNKQKNKVKFKIIEKKREFFDSKFIKTIDDPKKFWNNINELIYNKNLNKNNDFEIKNEQGHLLNDEETADFLNNYFINLPKETIEKYYGNLCNSSKKITSDYSISNSMFLQNVDEEEIFNTICILKNSFSTGVDEINTKITKECAISLSRILTHYINESFSMGIFPDCLKIAKVIPIYKKCGSKHEAKNYRPISLLNIISKIFESCLHSRLYGFLEKINFFVNNQFGFLKKSNTTSACISYIDRVQRALNNNKLVCTIFLDVAKAFDCVDRKILSRKLEQIGIRGRVLDIFNSYINNREQLVQINSSYSTIKKTICGVAQGSKLGPLLFLIYMNDIFELNLNGCLQLYADDSSITYISDNIPDIHKMIIEDLYKISKWFENNSLVLNADKSNLLFFNSKRKEISNFPDIFLNQSIIKKVDEMKYLGLIIDRDLTWNSHINSVVKKVSPYVGVFRRISFICNDNVKKLLYYAFFYSNIIYLLTLWSGTKKENIQKIRILLW